jgi:hypothetical protein
MRGELKPTLINLKGHEMTDKKRILVLMANPKSKDFPPLQLEQEFAKIDESLRRAGVRQQIELIYRGAITSDISLIYHSRKGKISYAVHIIYKSTI